MNAEIIKDKDGNNVPYVELKFSPEDPRDTPLYITFRKYPKRVFVGVEDYRDDLSSGADLEDCWLAPVYIIEKTLIEEFDPKQAFLKALAFAEAEHLEYTYKKLEPVVQEWLND